ncbi:MAG: XisI protein [Lyngbya sp.]|nr:XisI protein [Lyngbya sp.]
MERPNPYRELLQKILKKYASIPYSYGEINSRVIISQDRNHFLLVKEGWEGKKHIHHCLVHAEIRGDKIWIHYDGIEDSITEELVNAGISKDRIVLAFHPPYIREQTDYAPA